MVVTCFSFPLFPGLLCSCCLSCPAPAGVLKAVSFPDVCAPADSSHLPPWLFQPSHEGVRLHSWHRVICWDVTGNNILIWMRSNGNLSWADSSVQLVCGECLREENLKYLKYFFLLFSLLLFFFFFS